MRSRNKNIIDPNILSNNFDDLESETYYSSIAPNMVESSKMSSIDLSHDERFSDKTDNSELFDFIQKHETRYTPYVNTLKSSGVVRINSTSVANKLFDDLLQEFSTVVDSVEIFAVIIDYFGFKEKEYFDKLVLPTRLKLVKELSTRIDIGNQY